MNEKTETIVRGLVGVVFPAGGITVSILTQIELGLRLVSLVIGITVGLMTIWKFLRKKD
jgi:hypothetical protein